MKSVSIIVPAYNAQPFIRTVVQSLFNLRNDRYGIEVIVVNDASTDRTAQILESLRDHPATRDSQISYQVYSFSTNTPGGVSCGANYGLRKATGDYIAFLEADDWIVPDQFLKALQILDRGQYDFVLNRCWDYHMDSSERRAHGDHETLAKIGSGRFRIEELKGMMLRVSAVPWRKIYSHEFIEKNQLRFVEVDYAYEDNPFHWDVVLSATSIGLTDYHTHIYRHGHAGQSVSGSGIKFLKMLDHYPTLSAILQKHDRSEAFESQLVSWVIDHILWVGDRIPRPSQPLLFQTAATMLHNHSFETIISELGRFGNSNWVIDRILSIYYRDIRWFMSLK
jgi:glycosyltransferase involved in cell wall biosynthesis